MMKNYQTAIVTGASHGIGPFIVRAMAKEGMNLVLAARSGNELEQVATAADIRATGVHVLTVPTDVTDRDARIAFMSPPEAVAQAVLKSIRRDKVELVVMPGPGRLIRTLMTSFPGMGPAMNQMTGSNQTMKQIADSREQQRAQALAGGSSPVRKREEL